MAFSVSLGRCSDPKNKLVKGMSDVVSYQCTVKGHIQVNPAGGVGGVSGINVINPVIIIKGDNSILSKNYAYIPDFGRYYFVHDVEITPNGIYTLTLIEDVLMSWASDIKNCDVMLSRSADFRNYYLKDDRLPVTNRTLTWNKAFSKSPFKANSASDAIVTFIGPSK